MLANLFQCDSGILFSKSMLMLTNISKRRIVAKNCNIPLFVRCSWVIDTYITFSIAFSDRYLFLRLRRNKVNGKFVANHDDALSIIKSRWVCLSFIFILFFLFCVCCFWLLCAMLQRPMCARMYMLLLNNGNGVPMLNLELTKTTTSCVRKYPHVQ